MIVMTFPVTLTGQYRVFDADYDFTFEFEWL